MVSEKCRWCGIVHREPWTCKLSQVAMVVRDETLTELRSLLREPVQGPVETCESCARGNPPAFCRTVTSCVETQRIHAAGAALLAEKVRRLLKPVRWFIDNKDTLAALINANAGAANELCNMHDSLAAAIEAAPETGREKETGDAET